MVGGKDCLWVFLSFVGKDYMQQKDIIHQLKGSAAIFFIPIDNTKRRITCS